MSVYIYKYINLLVSTEKELSVPACCVFQGYSRSLQQITLPKEVIQRLHVEGFISKEMLQEMNISEGSPLSGSLLRSLRSTLAKDPNKLRAFATVLIQSEETHDIGRNILKDSGKSNVVWC